MTALCLSAPAVYAKVASCAGVTESTTRWGTKDGACWAYYCKDGEMYTLSTGDSSKCQSCPSGEVKYSVSGTCGTCKQTCCSDGNYSSCNKACTDPSETCLSSQCWDGSKCADQPTGKQCAGECCYTCQTWTCNKGQGWTCSKKGTSYKTSYNCSQEKGTYETGSDPGKGSCCWRTQDYYNSSNSTYSVHEMGKKQACCHTSCDATWSGSCDIIRCSYSSGSHKYTCNKIELTCASKQTPC